MTTTAAGTSHFQFFRANALAPASFPAVLSFAAAAEGSFPCMAAFFFFQIMLFLLAVRRGGQDPPPAEVSVIR